MAFTALKKLVAGLSRTRENLVTGLRTLGLTVITDQCLPDALKPVNIEEIIATAQKAEPQLCTIAESVIQGL